MSALTARQKAALFVLSLDEDVALELMRHFDGDQLKQLASAADDMHTVPSEAVEQTCEEFERRMRAPVLPLGPSQHIRKLASVTLGQERAEALFAPPVSEPLETIRAARAATLADLLNDEHPQVAAVVVSQLPRPQAAAVLKALPDERRADLLARIAALSEIPAEMVQLASEALAKSLESAGGIEEGSRDEFDGVAFTAGILNELAADETEKLLASIEERSSGMGPKIRKAMFIFEDLEKLNARALQVLMKEIPSEQLLVALKTASETLREHFLSAVSSRAATALREDLATMPPTRLSEVETAQREIVDTALRLASEDRLVLPTGSQEKLV